MALALFLLFAALGFFLVSARQFRQPERSFIWLMGAGLLAWAMWCVITEPGHYGLLRAILDAWSGDALVRAFVRNAGGVSQFLPQLLDLFLVAAGLLGLVALVAFTPGEQVERAVRPAILTVMGFMLGAVAALALVAVGLGGQVRPRTYIGYVSVDDIYDGDTFRLGEVSLRLWGVDAPELQQECRNVDHCSARARAYLASLIGDALVQCDTKQSITGRLTESFGRPLVRCWTRKRGQRPVDLAAAMISGGYAVPYRGETSYGYSDEEALGREKGLMRGCMLRPDIWRNNIAARQAFEQNRPLPADARVSGTCPMLENPP